MKPYVDLTDEQWASVRSLIPELNRRVGNKGRHMRGRPLCDTRAVLNAVLWVMYSGASWASMPRRYPSYQTCHRRFKNWHECGVMKDISKTLFGASADAFNKLIGSRMRSGGEPVADAPDDRTPPLRGGRRAGRAASAERIIAASRTGAIAGLGAVATAKSSKPGKAVAPIKSLKPAKSTKLVDASHRSLIAKPAQVAGSGLTRTGTRTAAAGKADARVSAASTSARTGGRRTRSPTSRRTTVAA